MISVRWILALVALAIWTVTYYWFFRSNIQRWLKERPVRRQIAREAAAEKAAAAQRLRDELAAKYPLPPAVANKPVAGDG